MTKGRVCPRCKSRNFEAIELWKDHAIYFSRGESEGILETGYPYKVEGECRDCGYRWTFRGVYQMNEDGIRIIWGKE